MSLVLGVVAGVGGVPGVGVGTAVAAAIGGCPGGTGGPAIGGQPGNITGGAEVVIKYMFNNNFQNTKTNKRKYFGKQINTSFFRRKIIAVIYATYAVAKRKPDSNPLPPR